MSSALFTETLSAPASGPTTIPSEAAAGVVATVPGASGGRAVSVSEVRTAVGVLVETALDGDEGSSGVFDSDPEAVWGRGGALAEVAVALRQALVSCLRSIRDERLEERLGLVSGCESALAAVKAEGVAELASLHGENAAADVLRDKLKASKATAGREVVVAGELAKRPDIAGALSAGDITPGQAELIAQAAFEAPEDAPIDELELLAAAAGEPEDAFARTVRGHLNEREQRASDLAERRRRQRNRRRATIRKQTDGMYLLRALLDPVTGARFENAILAECDRRWNAENPDDRPTSEQRTADALAQLVVHAASEGRGEALAPELELDSESGHGAKPKKSKRRVELVVIADYDVTARRLRNARLWDGTPLTADEFVELATEARVLPSIWKTQSWPLWLGRDNRHASHGQRIALTARDGGCIGCDKTGRRAEPHHIAHWEHGGPTDIDNLTLVCPTCHDNDIHRHGKQIALAPNGNFTLDHQSNGGSDNASQAHPRTQAPYRLNQHNQPLLC